MTLTITNNYTTEQFTHTKTGEFLTLLKVVDKLAREDYNTMLADVKAVGGFYSKFAKGFLLPQDVVINGNTQEEKQVEVFNLFDACNVSTIPELTEDYIDNLVKSTTGNEYKNITKEVKKQLAKRFPMCKFSGSTRNYNSISIYIVSSPFAKDGEELKAILNYAEKYLESYEYCTDYNPYGDYGSSYNFYGHVSVDYDYTQTQDDMLAICEQYAKDVQADEIVQEEKRKIEFAEYEKKQELERIESEKQQKNIKAQVEEIERNAKVVMLAEDKQYYIVDAKYGAGKESSLKKLQEAIQERLHKTTTKVVKNVYLNKVDFENFCNLFMYDFSFIAGTGGSYTDDARIGSRDDYSRMTEEERKTVEFINTDCVAIYCDDELKLVVDAQGYDYSRYVAIVEGCEVVATYNTNKQDKAITEHYRAIAEQLEDISFNVITDNNIDDFKNSKEYKEKMLLEIKNKNINLTKEVIQQIENHDLKSVMYRILDIYNSVKYKFENADFKPDTKMTILKISEWGGISVDKITYQKHEVADYAQYKDCIKVFCKVYKKRGLYSILLKDSDNFIVVDGWHDLPDDVLNTIEHKDNFIVTKSKYSSFDEQQIEDVKQYFNNANVSILM